MKVIAGICFAMFAGFGQLKNLLRFIATPKPAALINGRCASGTFFGTG
jgi:hypothetical protein